MSNVNSSAFKWKQRIGFGSIEFGRDLVQYMADLYLSIYLTTVALLPLPAISLMFLVCKIIDAITDVIVGALVDKTSTKWGRSRPWIYAGMVVYIIGITALFKSPEFSATGKIIYTYGAYIIYTLGMTMVNIPEGTLMAAITDDATERTMIGAVRNIGSTIANTVVGAIVVPLVAFFGQGNDQILGYSRTALLLGSCMVILVGIGNTVTKEVVKPVAKKASQTSFGETLKSIAKFFTCGNFNREMVLCFGMLLFNVATAATMAYYCTYILDGRMDLMALGFTAQSVGAFIPAFIVPLLNQKWSKRSITILGAVIAVVGLLTRSMAAEVPVLLIVGMAMAS